MDDTTLCKRCGKAEPLPSKNNCQRCREVRHKEYLAAKAKHPRFARRAAGLCVACANPSEPNKARCRKCADKLQAIAKKKIAQGFCYSCKVRKCILGTGYCERCRAKCVARSAKKRAERRDTGICISCGGEIESPSYRRCAQCRLRNANYALSVRRSLVTEVFALYGDRCQCCGEGDTQFLTLDHVNNDGAKERAELSTGSTWNIYIKVYKLARQQVNSGRYQLLCWNCNMGKFKNKGICPHKKNPRPMINAICL